MSIHRSRHLCVLGQLFVRLRTRPSAINLNYIRCNSSKDVFGTLSESGSKQLAIQTTEKFTPDDPDNYDKEEIDLAPRKHAFYYKKEIHDLARQGPKGIRRALELYQEMKSTARLEPDFESFAPLIYGCAKAGYTKRAFELYEESLRYNINPSNSMITCLFNACSESPFPEYGLERLEWFLTHLKVNFTNKELNLIQYNCAIKAYAKLGKLEEASKLVKQMIDNGVFPDSETFNSLLIGCASNRRAGTSIALRVFKRMKMFSVKPNLITYRTLLRCIRDCSMGSRELVQQTFNELPAVSTLEERINYQKASARKQNFRANLAWAPLLDDLPISIQEAVREPKERPVKMLEEKARSVDGKIEPATGSNDIVLVSGERDQIYEPIPLKEQYPNLLAEDNLIILRQIRALQFDKLSNRQNRLMLFGGPLGYLEAMLRDGCRPDAKTFCLILGCLDKSRENFIQFYELSKTFKIKRDLIFYDLLIGRVARNYEDKNRLELAHDLIDKMHLDDLRPNISTFEFLAFACHTWPQARQLIVDFKRNRFVISNQLIKNLFHVATATRNLWYLKKLFEFSIKENFKADKALVDALESIRVKLDARILEQEKDPTRVSPKLSDESIADFDEFREKFRDWLGQVELEEIDHPWSQFKVETRSKKEGFDKYVKHFKALEKVKEEALRRGGSLGNLEYKARKLEASRG